MRWLKHMTATPDDEKVANLLHNHGPLLYGIWWLVLEKVALMMPPNATEAALTYPIGTWSKVLFIPPNHVKMRLCHIEDEGLLKLSWSGVEGELKASCELVGADLKPTRCRVEIPNLLKYRDEYSQKSGHSPDRLRSKSQSHRQKQSQTGEVLSTVQDQPVSVPAAAEQLRLDRPPADKKSKEPDRQTELSGLLWYCQQPACRNGSDEAPDKTALKLLDAAAKLGMNGFEAAAKIERAWRKTINREDLKPQGPGWLFGVLRGQEIVH